jgi:hypothetical protein
VSILSGRDNAFDGMANQRVDERVERVYGAKTLNNSSIQRHSRSRRLPDSAPARAAA